MEDTLKGMDINPISLQLAASQLTTGNQDIGYRRMGLHRMPYGPGSSDPTKVSAGTLELLSQREIVPRNGELDLPDDRIASQEVWTQGGEVMEDAVDAIKDGVGIVIMNPPFTSRSKMGEKFPQETQQSLRKRVDDLERLLTRNDKDMEDFVDKNALGTLFVALADRCLEASTGILIMIHPTIALTNPSGQYERKVLAQRYHIHTVLTGRWPREFTLSQNVEIDECMVIAVRHVGSRPSTRFIQLDRMPHDEDEVSELHQALIACRDGQLADGWGEVSHWPTERIEAGDWTPAIWRSAQLAEAAARFAEDSSLRSMEQAGQSPAATGRLLRGSFEPAAAGTPGSFPILKSKATDGQTRIQSQPDEHWVPKDSDDSRRLANGGTYPEVDKIQQKAGHLLITAGQDSKTGRLTATADDNRYVGNGWMPIAELPVVEAKAAAVFINSTAGRLQLMRHPGQKIPFPTYSVAETANIRIPNVKDARIRQILSDSWERTRDMEVPQFRDGECEVRRLWDEAVADAMGWNADELARLRHLLHQEPHVRGLGYGEYGDEVDIEPTDRERFQELADQWEEETFFLSRSDRAIAHPAHQDIINLGQPVVPLILERMRSQGGHWFEALQQITGEDPVSPADYGNIAAMQNSWLQWGEDHGHA